MKQIRAFVGHSFTEDDKEIVDKFLKYFDQLSNSHPNFTWQHAEPFEPRLLDDKVIQLFQEKNLFICICTKKERVIQDNKLQKFSLFNRIWKANPSYFEWKTSDWIIQEIGLAKGLGLDLVLLIENGLRPPGGIQGNLEIIEFNRESPEKAFGKTLEMISALSPKTRIKPNEETESQLAPVQEQEISEP